MTRRSGPFYENPLMHAAMCSTPMPDTLLKSFIACNPVNLGNTQGVTALMNAIKFRAPLSTQMVLWNATDNDDVYTCDDSGDSLFAYALTYGSRAFLHNMTCGSVYYAAHNCTVNKHGHNMIMRAVIANRYDTIEFLIEKWCKRGASGAIVRVPDFIKHMVVYHHNKTGSTALHMSIDHNSDTAKLLMEVSNINARDALGRTPLMICCHKNKPMLVATLIKHGAVTEIKDNSSKTALDYAIEHKDGKCEMLLDSTHLLAHTGSYAVASATSAATEGTSAPTGTATGVNYDTCVKSREYYSSIYSTTDSLISAALLIDVNTDDKTVVNSSPMDGRRSPSFSPRSLSSLSSVSMSEEDCLASSSAESTAFSMATSPRRTRRSARINPSL